MNIITIIMIAFSLSMDAFSLSLIYGTQGIQKRDKMILSLIVGIFHFIMPFIGLTIGDYLLKRIPFNTNIIVGIIFIIIAIEMVLEYFKESEKNFFLDIPGCLLFGLSVSLDSMTTGIGLPVITNNYFVSNTIFAIMSFSFTFFGLNIGNKLNIKYGKLSTLIGGIILLILAIYYFLK